MFNNIENSVVLDFNFDVIVFKPVVLHVLELQKPMLLANQKRMEFVIPVIDVDQVFLQTQGL